MKKGSLILFLISCALISQAQKSFFGFEAGVNVANQRIVTSTFFNPTQISFQQNAIKPSFSIYYQFDWSEKIGARVKASYMELGFTGGQSSYNTLSKVDINYLMVPITLHYKANQHLSLTGGPYVSFTIGGSRPFNQDIISTYHKNDYGVSFGGEHDIYKGVALSVTYYIGLKNIWLDDRNGTIEYTNRALQIALIYKFKNSKLQATSND
jgi:hypothetical protein